MKARLRAAALLAGAFCCLLLPSGCADKPSESMTPDPIRIGVTLYRQSDTFISLLASDLLDCAKARETQDNVKITLKILDGTGNQGTQNEQVDRFLAQGYDAICVNEVDRTAASVIIDKARAADIPVIFFNREPVGEDMQRWQNVYYVGSDPREAGDMQGRIVVDLYDENPASVDRNGDGRIQYVILEGEPGHQDATLRTESCIAALTSAGIDVEKLASEPANWQRAQASAKMAQWLADEELRDRIEVIFCNNDDMALGAIDAYHAAEISELPVIVGIDATPPALLAIQDGSLAGTVRNDAQGQAQAIFDLAYALSTGANPQEAVPMLEGQYVWAPHSIVTIGNVMQEYD